MNRGIIYLLLGNGPYHHLALAAGVYTLCRHYDGPVQVYTDRDLTMPGIEAMPMTAKVPGPGKVRRTSYHIKQQLIDMSEFDSSVFLDVDTLIDGDVTPLFPDASDPTLFVTRYADWTVNHFQMQCRLDPFRKSGFVHPSRIAQLEKLDLPAVNGGVFGFSRACKIGPYWSKCSLGFDDYNLADEMGLQFSLPWFPHKFMPGDRYNCIPALSLSTEAVIWHHASHCFGENTRAFELWRTTILAMLDQDWGGINSWYPGNPEMMHEVAV